MASSQTSTNRRPVASIELSTTVPRTPDSAKSSRASDQSLVGGWGTAVLGAAAVAVSGWVLTAGFAVIGWLAAAPGTLADALVVGLRFWVLANGGTATLTSNANATAEGGTGAVVLSVTPWALTVLMAIMHAQFAGYAARRSRAVGAASALVGVVGAAVVTYVGWVVVTAVVIGETDLWWRAALTSALVTAISATWGACRALSLDPLARLPHWLRPLPRAVLAAQLALLVGGVALLISALVSARVETAEVLDRLGPGLVGNVALLVLQLIFAPNLIVWATSYALGAGFSFGGPAVVSPTDTDVGLLPALPVLAGLPDQGPTDPAGWGWLAVGVVAGALAGWLFSRAGEHRIDTRCLLGGLAGLASGLVFAGLAWLTGGDLGNGRLVGLGPRLPELIVLAGTTLGLAGLLAGLATGLIRRLRR